MKLDAPVVSSYALATDQGQLRSSSKKTLFESVARALGILDTMTINRGGPLERFGLDSMMAVELKDILEIHTHREFSMSELKALTLNDIASWESAAV